MPTPSLLIVPARFKSGRLYSQIPTSGGDFTVTRALGTATRVNASGLIESVASGIPRLDYFASGGTVGCPALLVEPAATNGIRNNSMVGAVAGTPGTLPTGGGWATVLRGLTQTVVGTGTENGINYIDIRFSGTATSTDVVEIRYESNTQIVASSGQTWAHSVYLKKIVEPNPPNNYQLSIYERDSGGGFVAFGASTIAPTTTIQRFTQTRTLSGALTARVQPGLFFGITNLQSYDFTIRIGYPQMELSSVATSVIPTTTGSVTRNADVISVSGAVSGSIGQTEGTMYFEVLDIKGVSTGTGNPALAIRNTAITNWIALTSNSTALPFRIIVRSTTTTLINYSSAITEGKVAIGYSASGAVVYVNGTEVASTVTNPNLTLNVVSMEQYMPFKVKSLALYTTRLTDAQLAALTT